MGLSGEIVVGGAAFAPPTTRPIFETAHFAGSKSCPPRSSPDLAGDCEVWHGESLICFLFCPSKKTDNHALDADISSP